MLNRSHLPGIAWMLILGSLLVKHTAAQEFRTLRPQQGLSQSIVTCIYHDSRGYIWIGTQDGLNRFDGYQFTVFRNEPDNNRSIPGNYIRCMLEDMHGNLWIGTDTEGLTMFDRKKETFHTYRHDPMDTCSISGNQVLALAMDASGRMFIGTSHGLCFQGMDGRTFHRHLQTGWGNLSINVLHSQPSGYLWIGTDQGIFVLDSLERLIKSFHHYPEDPSSLSNDQVHCFFEDQQGIIYAGTNQGLNLFDSELNLIKDSRSVQAISGYFRNAEVYAITSDHCSNLWVGTFGEGLIRYNIDNQIFDQFQYDPDQPGSLSNDYIFCLIIDRSGMLWAGTYGGGINQYLQPFVAFNIIHLDDQQPLTGSTREIHSIYSDPAGYVWFGTDKGLFMFEKENGAFSAVHEIHDHVGMLGNSQIYAIEATENRTIWVGTSSGEIFRIDDQSKSHGPIAIEHMATIQTESPGTSGVEINCINAATNGGVWVGTSNGLYRLDSQGNIHSLFPRDVSGEPYAVYCLQGGHDKGFFAGTNRGLTHYDHANGRLEPVLLEENDHRINVPVYSLYLDRDSVLWIGTDTDGLYGYHLLTNRVEHYSTQHGLTDNVIYGILEDDDRQLWFSTNKGLSRGTRHTDGTRMTFVNFGSSEGLKTDAFNIGAYARSNNNLLFFGGSGGITWFDPREVARNTYIPPVYITDLQLFYESVRPDSGEDSPLTVSIAETRELILRHNQNLLTFTFASLNFKNSNKNKYACKLEGFDNEWTFPQDRTVTYMNLPAGTYTFRVKASNDDGIWNEKGVSLPVIIRPPFTQTVWFYLITATGITLLIITISQIRTHQLREAKRELEKQVQKRTQELNETNMNLELEIMERKRIALELTQKNTELNKLLEDLRKTQTQLINSEKMASLGQLTAGIAHEINNPINFVSGNIAPLTRDIEDLLVILSTYEEIIEKNGLTMIFADVDQLKSELDYALLLEEIRKLLIGIKEGAQRTSEIVKGLRNFSRLDEDELKLTDIQEGIESTLLILGNKLKKGITVKRHFKKTPQILCYPGQLNQVFMNIFTNAIQAMEGEGTLAISTGMENERIFIRIKDTGKGMAEDVKNRIFEPFFTTKDVGQGTGLGLSISYGIIEKHNGSIRVESEPGKGSEFIIELPVNQDNN